MRVAGGVAASSVVIYFHGLVTVSSERLVSPTVASFSLLLLYLNKDSKQTCIIEWRRVFSEFMLGCPQRASPLHIAPCFTYCIREVSVISLFSPYSFNNLAPISQISDDANLKLLIFFP